MGMMRNVAMAAGLSMAASAGVGFMVESHTNEVAKGKIITIDACMDVVPASEVITDELKDCFDNGVPGGRTVGKDHFKDNDPIEFVESYRTALLNEADTIELGRVALWSIAPIIITGGCLVFGS